MAFGVLGPLAVRRGHDASIATLKTRKAPKKHVDRCVLKRDKCLVRVANPTRCGH